MNKWRLVVVMMAVLTAVLVGCGPTDTVTAGEGSLQLTLTLPDGYHLNNSTISRVTWEVDGVVVEAEAELDTELVTLEEPLQLPVTFAEGKAEAVVHLNILYCSDDETQCFVEKQDFKLPVHVAATGNRSTLAAEWAIVPPKS